MYEKLNELVAKTIGWKAPLIEFFMIRPDCPVSNFDYFNPPPELEEWRSNYHWRDKKGACWNEPPNFAENMLKAMEALDQFEKWELGKYLSTLTIYHKTQYTTYQCKINIKDDIWVGNGISTALAVCIAILSAKGIPPNEIEEALKI
jgi:hypothetical protein